MNKPFVLHLGDCLETMRRLPDNSVDSVVTDPPYGLSFMNHKWDYNVPSTEIWAECLRVLKPGGHLLAFAGTRTQHRMGCRIEDAGFEIRDMIAWVYGSGFPKSHNLYGDHEGWGTALKPAIEPVTVARKPFKGTVAANVLAFGTGAINIGGCRVAPTGESRERTGESSQDRRYTENGGTDFAVKPGVRGGDPNGRWPANLIHDGSSEVVAMFPDAPGQQGASSDDQRTRANCYGALSHGEKQYTPRVDSGSAARFFYCAKTSRKDRNDGLVDPGPQFKRGSTMRKVENTETTGNTHPTVKPTDLMAYLLRLVTPPGGTALDPFMGSGSTGKAAIREGFRFIGCELSPEYMAIARARIEHEHLEQYKKQPKLF